MKKIGLTVLISGFVVGGLVYRFGTRPRDFGNDTATIGFYKPQARQMGMLYGQMGVMMDDLLAALKRPGVQALIIVAVCTVACLICFQLARLREVEEGLPQEFRPSS